MRTGTASHVHLCRPVTATQLTMAPLPWAAAAPHSSCMRALRIHVCAHARATQTALQGGTALMLSRRAGHWCADHATLQHHLRRCQFLPTDAFVPRWVRVAAQETICGSVRPHPSVAHARDTTTACWACTVHREAIVVHVQKESTLRTVQVLTTTVARPPFWKCIATTLSFQQ